MVIGLHEDRRRRRRRLQWAVFKGMIAFALIAAGGFYAYETGRRLASTEIVRLQQKIDTLTAQLEASEEANAGERATASAALATARDWQTRYERDVARGVAKELFDLIQQRLSAGVEPNRLKTVLTITQNRRECRREAERRLFFVPVKMQMASRSALVFSKGLITLVIAGAPARDSSGNAEAWFDDGQPVSIRLGRSGAPASEINGLLPLSPSLIIGEREYTFRIVPAKTRGNVDIFGESCRFP